MDGRKLLDLPSGTKLVLTADDNEFLPKGKILIRQHSDFDCTSSVKLTHGALPDGWDWISAEDVELA